MTQLLPILLSSQENCWECQTEGAIKIILSHKDSLVKNIRWRFSLQPNSLVVMYPVTPFPRVLWSRLLIPVNQETNSAFEASFALGTVSKMFKYSHKSWKAKKPKTNPAWKNLCNIGQEERQYIPTVLIDYTRES